VSRSLVSTLARSFTARARVARTEADSTSYCCAPANAGAPGTWTVLYSEAWNTASVPLSGVTFELKAGTWRIEGANPGTAVFDNFKAAKP